MNVLSLFDGMSCGQIALKDLGVHVNKYYASEIDKYAIAQTQLNFPETIQLGDVENWREWDVDWASINLLIGGSPCQGFSFAGKQLAFDDPRSRLFFVYVDILEHIRKQNTKVLFLLENVVMKKEHISVISECLGIYPVLINSSLVSAQNRQRLYWSNIRTRREGLFGDVYTDIPQPEDRGIVIKDILEDNVDDKFFLKDNVLQELIKHKQRAKEKGYGFGINPCKTTGKMNTLSVGGRGMSDLIDLGIYQRPRGENKGGVFYKKAPTLTSCSYEQNNLLISNSIRRLTPTECARLQTIPEWYKWQCSDSQAYKMLGNGWTVEVIKHIFKFL